MKAGLSEDRANEYASWFRCLADGTRLLILNLVASAGRAMTVGEIVEAVGKSQSTVSRHLQVLASQGFVITEPDGVRTLVTANPECMTALPAAAAEVMGGPPSEGAG
jgi:DNA-binding transcriptional ArsR family regulator